MVSTKTTVDGAVDGSAEGATVGTAEFGFQGFQGPGGMKLALQLNQTIPFPPHLPPLTKEEILVALLELQSLVQAVYLRLLRPSSQWKDQRKGRGLEQP